MWEFLKGNWGENGEMFVDLDKLSDLLSTFAMYATIAVAVVLAAVAIAIRNKDEQYLASARKVMLGVLVGYSAAVIAMLGFVKIMYYYFDEKINANFWLTMGLFLVVAVLITINVILSKRKVAARNIVALVSCALVAVYALVLAFAVPAKKDYYEPINDGKALMYLLTLLLVAAAAVIAIFLDKKSEYDARALTYGAVCIAASFALSYIKMFSLPQGGSVTFASLLPLMLYCYMFGVRRGMLAGVVYGLLQFIQSPQFYQPMQALLDYPIAFGVIGLAGMGRNLKFLKGNIFAEFNFGAVVAVVFRYLAHVISGYFVFGSWAMEGYTPLTWALVYNLFTFADLAIVLIIGNLALASRTLRGMVKSVN